MKLLNRTIICGGKFGCAMVFEFGENSTVEFAAKVLREHRAQPNHMQDVLDETNVRRMLDGLAPLTMDELLGREPQKPRATFSLYDEVKEGVLFGVG